jgi:hypothetical protein
MGERGHIELLRKIMKRNKKIIKVLIKEKNDDEWWTSKIIFLLLALTFHLNLIIMISL